MKQNKLREQIAEQFIAALQEDQLPWRAMWITNRPLNIISGKKYRGINSFWLSFVADMKGYHDHRWVTFKQAESKGWHVRKGEKATHIEYWRLYDKLQKKYIEQSEANQIVKLDPDRADDIILSCRTYAVFNAEQVEGIPELKQETVIDIDDIRNKRDTLLNNMNLAFHEGGTQAYYRPSNDSITMPPASMFKDNYGYMSVFLHECGHATGHESRLNRDMTGKFGSESYAKEELRAEIASAFTSQALGLGHVENELSSDLDNHKAYVQNWIEVLQNEPKELFAAIKDAEKISDYLLEKGEFLQEHEHETARENPSPAPISLDEKIKGAELICAQQIPTTKPERFAGMAMNNSR